MFQIFDESIGNLIGIKVERKLTQEDFDELLPHLESTIRFRRKIRLLVDISDFEGIEFAALWGDLKFGLRHGRDVEKMAVVGSKGWVDWWAQAGGALGAAEVRSFGTGEIDAAWDWVKT